MLGELHQWILSQKRQRTKLILWPGDILRKHNKKTPHIFQTYHGFKPSQSATCPVLSCGLKTLSSNVPISETTVNDGPSPTRFPSVFFPARLRLTSSRHRRIGQGVHRPCSYKAPGRLQHMIGWIQITKPLNSEKIPEISHPLKKMDVFVDVPNFFVKTHIFNTHLPFKKLALTFLSGSCLSPSKFFQGAEMELYSSKPVKRACRVQG